VSAITLTKRTLGSEKLTLSVGKVVSLKEEEKDKYLGTLFGATTFSTMTVSIKAFGIMKPSIMDCTRQKYH